MHDTVVVDFVGRVSQSKHDKDGPVFQEVKDWLVTIGDKDVVPGLEMGIRFMSVGNKSLVWSHSKFAFGPYSRKHGDFELPPESNVMFEVTVKKIIPEAEQQKPQFTLQMGRSKKDIANDLYANEWDSGTARQRALYLYEKAAKDLDYLLQISEDEALKSETKELLVDCLNNVVVVHLRAKDYNKAKKAAVKVLQKDPDNFKALLRAAKAALLDPASSYEEVDAALEAASEKADSATDKDLIKLKADFRKRKQQYAQKSKEMYSKALAGGASPGTSGKGSTGDKALGTVDEKENARAQTVDEVAEVNTSFDWRKLPWKKIILPYAFQLLLPFVMWMVAQRYRADRPVEGEPGSSLKDEEF